MHSSVSFDAAVQFMAQFFFDNSRHFQGSSLQRYGNAMSEYRFQFHQALIFWHLDFPDTLRQHKLLLL